MAHALDKDFLNLEPDWYIFAVQYDAKHRIVRVKATYPSLIGEMTETIATREETIACDRGGRPSYTVMDRQEIVNGLNGKTVYRTVIFDGDGNYSEPGADVTTQKVGRATWIKTIPNDTEDDNLGELPEFLPTPAS